MMSNFKAFIAATFLLPFFRFDNSLGTAVEEAEITDGRVLWGL